jgi:mandelate racemase
MNASAQPSIRSLEVRAVQVPMRIPLQTSSGTIRTAPLALLDLHTSAGVTGRTYLFCYTPLVLKPVCELLSNLGPILQGASVAPLELDREHRGSDGAATVRSGLHHAGPARAEHGRHARRLPGLKASHWPL